MIKGAGNLHSCTVHTYAHIQFLCQFRIAELGNNLFHQHEKLLSHNDSTEIDNFWWNYGQMNINFCSLDSTSYSLLSSTYVYQCSAP